MAARPEEADESIRPTKPAKQPKEADARLRLTANDWDDHYLRALQSNLAQIDHISRLVGSARTGPGHEASRLQRQSVTDHQLTVATAEMSARQRHFLDERSAMLTAWHELYHPCRIADAAPLTVPQLTPAVAARFHRASQTVSDAEMTSVSCRAGRHPVSTSDRAVQACRPSADELAGKDGDLAAAPLRRELAASRDTAARLLAATQGRDIELDGYRQREAAAHEAHLDMAQRVSQASGQLAAAHATIDHLNQRLTERDVLVDELTKALEAVRRATTAAELSRDLAEARLAEANRKFASQAAESAAREDAIRLLESRLSVQGQAAKAQATLYSAAVRLLVTAIHNTSDDATRFAAMTPFSCGAAESGGGESDVLDVTELEAICRESIDSLRALNVVHAANRFRTGDPPTLPTESDGIGLLRDEWQQWTAACSLLDPSSGASDIPAPPETPAALPRDWACAAARCLVDTVVSTAASARRKGSDTLISMQHSAPSASPSR